MTPDAPIGIFDSGVGGLTVARSIADQLPGERLRYVGDTANNPYGSKQLTEIRRHTLNVTDALVRSGIKMLVIACNTASAACLADARERYPIPVVEVVLPAVQRAISTTRTNRVGVIGTLATINSQAYQDAFTAAPNVNLTALACPRFVDFIERGITSGRQILGLAQGYLERMQRANVDTVVLGCTHYPLLTGVLQIILGSQVTMVSSSEEAAKEVVRVLTELDQLADPPNGRFPRHEFTSTGPAEPFARLARRFLGPQLGAPSLGQHTPVPR